MDKSPKPVSNISPFGLRMQPALREQVEQAAKANARSLNQEIISRLEQSFRSTDAINTLSSAAMQALSGVDDSNEIIRRMNEIIMAQSTIHELQGEVINSLMQDLQKPVRKKASDMTKEDLERIAADLAAKKENPKKRP